MEQYIPKSALVAEIERLRSKVDLSTRHGEGLADAYHAVRKILDTFEVKCVNLEKEIQKQFDFHKNSDDNSLVKGFVVMNKDGFEYFAKHFFELALSLKK